MGILNSMSEALNKNKQTSQTQTLQQSPTPISTPAPIQQNPSTQNQETPVNNKNTMASNVANILNSNSLLMNSAAAKGEMMAASRGLQNSTLGAEASQRAMIDAAMTIAQIDTEHSHQKGMAQLTHNNAMKELSAQVSANTIGKSIDFTMQITNNFDAQIAAVLNNTQMKEEDKKRAIEQLKASRDSELAFMSKFMQHVPTTHKNWINFPNLSVPTISM